MKYRKILDTLAQIRKSRDERQTPYNDLYGMEDLQINTMREGLLTGDPVPVESVHAPNAAAYKVEMGNEIADMMDESPETGNVALESRKTEDKIPGEADVTPVIEYETPDTADEVRETDELIPDEAEVTPIIENETSDAADEVWETDKLIQDEMVISEPPAPENSPAGTDATFGAESDATLDDEIANLLEADKIMPDNQLDFEDINYVKDVSVFDRERRSLHEAMMQANAYGEAPEIADESGPGEGSAPEKRRIQPKKPIVITGALVLCTLLAVSAVLFYSRRIPAQVLPGLNPAAIPVKISDNAINNASYVFFGDNNNFLEGLDIQLKKMVYGQLSSIFYFNGDSDLSRYVFMLEDLSGKAYARDQTTQNGPGAVAFRPFEGIVKGFRLTIYDMRNDRTKALRFAVKDKDMMPARYINKPINISPGDGDGIYIDSAVFANTGAKLQIRLPYGADGGIIVTPDTQFSLSDGAYAVLFRNAAEGLYYNTDGGGKPQSSNIAYMAFQDKNMALARADFDPTRSLDGNITFGVKSLARVFYPRMTMASADLFNFAAAGAKTVPFEGINLVIEGMQHQGGALALVMHGEDTGAGARMEVKADVDLLAENVNGEGVTYHGACRSGPRGTDIMFAIGSPPAVNLDPARIQVRINSLQYAIGDINAYINLSELDTEALPERKAAQAALEGSFDVPAQTDLLYVENGGLVGTVLETPGGVIAAAPVVHVINAKNAGDQWVIISDDARRVVEQSDEVVS